MVATNLASVLSSGPHNLAASRAPRDILAGITLVLDAADVVVTGGKVETFLGPPVVTQATVGKRAAHVASDAQFGGRPVATFVSDGAGGNYNGYELPSLAGLTQGEVFAVLATQYNSATLPNDKYSGLWRFGADFQNVAYPYPNNHVYDSFGSTVRKDYGDMSAYAFRTPHIYNVSSIAADFTARFNGATMFTTATNTAGFTSAPVFGYWDATFDFNGRLAYLVFCNQVQTAAARAEMTQYLATRFAISL